MWNFEHVWIKSTFYVTVQEIVFFTVRTICSNDARSGITKLGLGVTHQWLWNSETPPVCMRKRRKNSWLNEKIHSWNYEVSKISGALLCSQRACLWSGWSGWILWLLMAHGANRSTHACSYKNKKEMRTPHRVWRPHKHCGYEWCAYLAVLVLLRLHLKHVSC